MRLASYWSHTFLPDLIHPDGTVFDFGVNSGGFSALVAPLCRRVIGFEPDPMWKGRLSLPDNVHVTALALAARRGRVLLRLNRESCPSLHYADLNAESLEVEAITFEDALEMEPRARVDLVKIDIEGEEVPVLLGAAPKVLQRVAQMTVEFHDFLEPKSLPAIRSIIERLECLGFVSVRFSWHSYGDVLFVNQRLVPLSAWERASLKVLHKYWRGCSRIVGRAIAGRWKLASTTGHKDLAAQ
jgi:FkbM family methyltransferase